MSVMYGQVCGRRRNAEEIAAEALDSTAAIKPVRFARCESDVSRGELKGAVKTPKDYDALKASKAITKRTLDQIRVKRKAKESDDEPKKVLSSASDPPEITEYARSYSDKCIFVDLPCGQRKYFNTVAQAAEYIKFYENESDITEGWLSLLLANGYKKYHGFTIGLVSKGVLDNE